MIAIVGVAAFMLISKEAVKNCSAKIKRSYGIREFTNFLGNLNKKAKVSEIDTENNIGFIGK